MHTRAPGVLSGGDGVFSAGWLRCTVILIISNLGGRYQFK